MTEELNEESRIMNQAEEKGKPEETDEEVDEKEAKRQFELLKERMTRAS